MTPPDLLRIVIDPGLAFMASVLGPRPTVTPAARVMLLAIWGQEGDFKFRRQIGGPARSYGQFESGGGIAGVLAHPLTGPWARQICAALDIPSDRATVFEAVAWNDHLSVAMTRLLLWTDVTPLPEVGEQAVAYACYAGLWRPGKPGPDRWPGNYSAAVAAVTASS
jgi:hypothetical protein